MPFGVFIQDTEYKEELKSYFIKLVLKQKELMFNPWDFSYKRFDDDLFLFHFEPKAPRIYLIGIGGVLSLFLFKGLTWWMIAPVLISLMGVFWLDRFYFLMMKIGLFKLGLKKGFVFLSSKNVVMRWFESDK